jgi:hypothetical protein
MNKWNDFVITLLDCKQRDVKEDEYQKNIEEQFKFLGWSKFNGCIETKPILPVGNSNSLIPDIVLKKDGVRVVPIEIKQPNNKIKPRQELQLISYMLQLKIYIGVYIGSTVQIYYDNPEDNSKPHCVLKAELEPDNPNGISFCSLFEYENFSTVKIEQFCKKKLDLINYRQKIRSWIKNEMTTEYVKNLIIDKLSQNSPNVNILKEEIDKVKVTIGNFKETPKKAEKKKTRKYSLNGSKGMFKSRLVLEALRLYMEKHPDSTYEQIESVFPKSVQGGYGVVRKLSEINDYQEAGSNLFARYFSTPQEILKSSDGIDFVVCNQWDYNNFPKLIRILKNLKWKVKES